MTRFTVRFHDSLQRPERMDSQYSNFHSSVDFVEKKMHLRVKIQRGLE